MSQSQHNAVVLKKSNQARFNQLWANFAKSETNAMRLSQYMQFVIDRSLVSNRTTIRHFYQLFTIATQKRISLQPPPVHGVVMEKTINKIQFIFLLNQLGKYLYHNDKNHQDKIYNDLLGQKTHAQKDAMHYQRVMIMDQINRKMLFQNAIKTLANYEYQFKGIFLVYIQQNYWSLKKHNRLLLSQRQVQLQNKRMSAVSYLRFLKQSDILPHLINVEHAQQILNRCVPAINSKQSQFYYKHFLVDIYSKDLDNPDIKSEGDPGLLFFQFMFCLARIAVQTSKQIDNAKKAYDYIVNKFYSSYLYLRNNQQIEQKKPLVNINKSYFNHLRKYYNLKQNQENKQFQEDPTEDQYNPFEDLKGKQAQLQKMQPIQFNVPTMLRILNNQLPPMPQKITVKQELPPPYAPKFKDVPKITIGQQPPPQKQDKNKNSQKPAPKKQQLKKGQKPPRVFKYLDQKQQTEKVLSSQDYLQKLATQLDYSLKPLSSLQRGNIPLDPFPSLISQILYPPQVPQEVLPYIEAAINSHNDGSYALALQNYNKACQQWRKQQQLSPSLQLYFQFSKGGVYLSAGKDDYAFNCFFNCRNYLQKIPYLNPDRALPFCGLGQSLYNAEEYELAARCFLKARQIRQSLLGVQSVDTVTTYNNIGCCFFMLDRPKQALSYFKISREVMIAQLGQFHQRSQTTRQNVNLCNKAFYQNTPEYRKLWEVFEKDMFGKKKKKKKKDGKKK